MYWPYATPNVYTAPRRSPTTDEAREDELDRADAASDEAIEADADADTELPARDTNKLHDADRPHDDDNNDEDKAQEGGEAQEKGSEADDETILGLRTGRNGQVFATITSTTLDIWQASPVLLVASMRRSDSSLQTYGHNTAVLLRPDCSIAAVQTALGFLVTFNISFDDSARVYQQLRLDERSRRMSGVDKIHLEEARMGYREVLIAFRMVIKIDAGIQTALALDDDLVVATQKPAAVQCIKWAPEDPGSQTITELLSRLPWIERKSVVEEIVHDRAMSLFIWIVSEGNAYAVQRLSTAASKGNNPKTHFRGHGLHQAQQQGTAAVKASINARFSLLAIGCENAEVLVYAARDYAGSLPLSHKLQPPASRSTTGAITSLTYSPDGYCLFVGFQHGWTMWSVYGKMAGSSFTAAPAVSAAHDERWLLGVQDACWTNGGSEIIMTSPDDRRIWSLEIMRSALIGCLGPANVTRMLFHTASNLVAFRGHQVPDVVAVAAEDVLWEHIQIPSLFLLNQRPIRCAVISPDGRYIAVAGRRGLAHFSVHSSRWKTFDDVEAESAFVVRGGMFWHQHILVAAVDTGECDEIRMYSRETGLTATSMICRERLPARAVTLTPTGEDSLLVYTSENNLFHYVMSTVSGSLELVRVGQIGLHGIVRAPARVRAVTWYLPEEQLLDGDPTQDVVHASVIFLVDAKLVLLQPTRDEAGAVKYDMRIIASDVEFFGFVRDQAAPLLRAAADAADLQSDPFAPTAQVSPPPTARSWPPTSASGSSSFPRDNPLRESVAVPPSPILGLPPPGLLDALWFFDGRQVAFWPSTHELVRSVASTSSSNSTTPLSSNVTSPQDPTFSAKIDVANAHNNKEPPSASGEAPQRSTARERKEKKSNGPQESARADTQKSTSDVSTSQRVEKEASEAEGSTKAAATDQSVGSTVDGVSDPQQISEEHAVVGSSDSKSGKAAGRSINSGQRPVPSPVSISVDFYPTCMAWDKGIVLGLEADLVQRRDLAFASYRSGLRTELFLPSILRHQLETASTASPYTSSPAFTAAVELASTYQNLPYFAHALELLLHLVLDDEVETPPASHGGEPVLPVVIAFLARFPSVQLDVIVRCARKTEVRSWRTLFDPLPPPTELFAAALRQGRLQTAASYLLVLREFDEHEADIGRFRRLSMAEGMTPAELARTAASIERCVQVLEQALLTQEWELVRELSQFLLALDDTGDVLRDGYRRLGIEIPEGSGFEAEPIGSPDAKTSSQIGSPDADDDHDQGKKEHSYISKDDLMGTGGLLVDLAEHATDQGGLMDEPSRGVVLEATPTSPITSRPTRPLSNLTAKRASRSDLTLTALEEQHDGDTEENPDPPSPQ